MEKRRFQDYIEKRLTNEELAEIDVHVQRELKKLQVMHMKKTILHCPEIKLVGISVRTNNVDEMNPDCAKIGITMKRYFSEGLPEKIKARKNPGTTLCVYTQYESDHTEDYTYFMGEEVNDFEDVPQGLEKLTIPPQRYVKFTSNPGPMPHVIIDMWQNIWEMNASALGGTRAYRADLQVHDQRSLDPKHAIIDVYIGIKE